MRGFHQILTESIRFVNGSNIESSSINPEIANSLRRSVFGSKKRQSSNDQFIYLLSETINFNFFKSMPRLFTITTNTSSAKFNIDLLINTSSVISKFINENPNELQYHLDINDEGNIISLFEQLYLGNLVTFDEDELIVVRKITNELNLSCCPNFMKNKILSKGKNGYFGFSNNDFDLRVKISYKSLENYLQSDKSRKFTIQTKKSEYICNFFAVLSSTKIDELIKKEPKLDHYFYDFEDEENEFQIVCDILNFKKVNLTRDNVEIIQEIFKDLGIECFSDIIEKFISESEKVMQTIDDQQNIINMIDELFDLLYNIKSNSIAFVANWIKESKWSKTEENVIELAAFINQVICSSIQLHSYMLDLLIKLDEESNDTNQLKILLPFIIKMAMNELNNRNDNIINNDTKKLMIPFIYRLYKKGFIPKEKIRDAFKFRFITNPYLISWFLPELFEFNVFFSKDNFSHNNIVLNGSDDEDNEEVVSLYYPCNSTNMDAYNRMRDKGEYDDAIATALRNDDIDTFQSIISKSGENSLQFLVKNNMFEPFFTDDVRYLNYAAAYGSIKCFKYLLLNNENVDNLTFELAIIGGNNELIRIVNNEKVCINTRPQKSFAHRKNDFKQTNKTYRALLNSISLHKNDLFDWILEQKFDEVNENDILYSLSFCSIENGNPHSLVHLIDNGFNFQQYSNSYSTFLKTASIRGFYLLDNILINMINKNSKEEIKVDRNCTYYFNNILIFKLFDKTMNQNDLEICLYQAIQDNLVKFIEHFLETLTKQNFIITSKNAVEIITRSIKSNPKELLNYVIEKVNNSCPINNFDVAVIYNFLDETIKAKNTETSIKFANLIYDKNHNNDFTSAFISAATNNLKEVIQHFIDRKFRLNLDIITNKKQNLSSFDVEIFSMLMKIVNHDLKIKMTQCLDEAIQNNNKQLAKFLLNENVFSESCLYNAVNANDLELVELILEKNSSPFFINKCFDNKNPLILAAKLHQFDICKKLILIPGIDPSIYTENFKTPLVISVSEYDFDIFKLIIDFYGDKIKDQKWQVEKALSSIIDSNKDANDDSEDDEDNEKNKLTCKTSNDVINKFLKVIIDLHCIDPNYRFENHTLLTFACKINSNEIVELLLKCDGIDTNSYSPLTGNTPLIESIMNENEKIAELLINQPKTNINQKDYKNQSPLLLASDIGLSNIIDLLINNEKFDPEESNINLAFLKAPKIFGKKIFSFKTLDVNYVLYNDIGYKHTSAFFSNINTPITIPDIRKDKSKIAVYAVCPNNYRYTPPILDAVLNDDFELIDSIVQHPSFDKNRYQYSLAIQFCLLENKIQTLQRLFQTNEEIDIICTNQPNYSLLVEASIKSSNEKIASCTINYPSFDSFKSYINLEINQNGFSILKEITNDTNFYKYLLCFLLENGFDPNKPLQNGNYLLEEAIKMSNESFSIYLIKISKIDFNIKIPNQMDKSKFTTYFHLAARFGRTKLINEIIKNNLCNINITNDFGDSPLMEACRYKQIECIKLFNNRNITNLDYLHRNNNGDDALKISKDKMKSESSKKEFRNHSEYINELINILLGNNKSKFGRRNLF